VAWPSRSGPSRPGPAATGQPLRARPPAASLPPPAPMPARAYPSVEPSGRSSARPKGGRRGGRACVASDGAAAHLLEWKRRVRLSLFRTKCLLSTRMESSRGRISRTELWLSFQHCPALPCLWAAFLQLLSSLWPAFLFQPLSSLHPVLSIFFACLFVSSLRQAYSQPVASL